MVKAVVTAAVAALFLSGCATSGPLLSAGPAALVSETRTTSYLVTLPPPRQPLDVAVYEFADLTGQARPNPNFAESSRAVTQGGAQILVDVLTTVGNGAWFRIAERTGLRNLVQERTLIENTGQAYGGVTALPPIRFAGIILEGGIVGYDSDEITGGAGARYFGIGAETQYRSDLVTVNLRAVSVQNGEVLISTTTSKQIFSYMNRAGAYLFAEPQRLLEVDIGHSRNDPTQLAVREAIELAVYSLIVQGMERGLWSLPDRATQDLVIASYNHYYNM